MVHQVHRKYFITAQDLCETKKWYLNWYLKTQYKFFLPLYNSSIRWGSIFNAVHSLISRNDDNRAVVSGIKEGNENMYNILVCDDDKKTADELDLSLSREGCHVLKAYSKTEALSLLDEEDVSLLIIDPAVSKPDGIQTILKIRKQNILPIIILSAQTDDSSKILGLNAGADDYVTKPFNPLVLIARVRSHLRRYTELGGKMQKQKNRIYEAGGLRINDNLREVTVDGEAVRLTRIEYSILLLLIKNQGKIFSNDQIYKLIWNEESLGADNTVAVHIRHIREKIETDPGEPQYLKLVWGVGYKIEITGDTPC